jgi:hypothetical protein
MGRTADERLVAYLSWASESARMLRNQVSVADLDRLIFTKRYELLLGGVADLGGQSRQRALNDLLSMELDERVAAITEAREAFEKQIGRWTSSARFVIADTSVYIEHDQKLEELDLRALLGVSASSDVHLLVPIIIVDELDGLKRSSDKQKRWRAAYTLARFDLIFQNSAGPVSFNEADDADLPQGQLPGDLTAELVFDPPRHVRLPINDDEIIDRALAIEPLAARKITLLTFDTGQATRARYAGLLVQKLTKPIGEEPEPTEKAGRRHEKHAREVGSPDTRSVAKSN